MSVAITLDLSKLEYLARAQSIDTSFGTELCKYRLLLACSYWSEQVIGGALLGHQSRVHHNDALETTDMLQAMTDHQHCRIEFQQHLMNLLVGEQVHARSRFVAQQDPRRPPIGHGTALTKRHERTRQCEQLP